MELPELDLSAAVWRGHERSFKAATVTSRFFFLLDPDDPQAAWGGGGESQTPGLFLTVYLLGLSLKSLHFKTLERFRGGWGRASFIIQERVSGEAGSVRFHAGVN